MQIEIPESCHVREQAVAAGYANVEEYVVTLLDRDAERIAIKEGLDAMNQGRVRPFEDFDREFRQQNKIVDAD